jgi:hypothetical protein
MDVRRDYLTRRNAHRPRVIRRLHGLDYGLTLTEPVSTLEPGHEDAVQRAQPGHAEAHPRSRPVRQRRRPTVCRTCWVNASGPESVRICCTAAAICWRTAPCSASGVASHMARWPWDHVKSSR